MPDVEALPAPTAPAPAVAGRRKWLVAEIAWTVLAWVAAIVIARVSFATESRSPVLLIALMGVMQALTFLWITMRFAKIIAELASRERRAEWATTELTAGEFVWRETKRPFLIMLLPAWSAFPLILGAVFYGCKLNSYAITLAVLCMPLAAAFATIFFLRRIYQLLYAVCESADPSKISNASELRELAGQSLTIGTVAYAVIGVLSIQPPFIIGITVGAFMVGITVHMLTDSLFHLREVYPLKDGKPW
jgi:hypothetical protein